MASFAVASTGTRGLNSVLYPSSSSVNSLRSAGGGYGFSEKMSPIICLPERSKARWSLTVKSMGGMAKFKGTQMREKKLTEMIEKKVMEAKEVCEGDGESSDECKVAWDEVEEERIWNVRSESRDSRITNAII
ncbi:hypothetical protein F0562_036213 [Nyssa sinensis]|uniref:Uncharacterized protein n=1 Tax=Nyssa sinensis TaxID=561372 RepID=A0A5J5AFA3_9ASTE|nr:hypothetical protein F0562_036213 [Nyssa sinensis]